MVLCYCWLRKLFRRLIFFTILVRRNRKVPLEQFDKISQIMIADQFCNILNGEVTLFQKVSGLLKSDFLNDRSNSSTVFVKQFAEIRLTDMKIFCNCSGRGHWIIITDIRINLIITYQPKRIGWRDADIAE